MSKITGATLLVRSLRQQGVEHMFGVVGFPVQPVAAAAQKEGMTYVGMRNEQAASYAAQAAGYLTGRPGACLTVCGPGVIHALAGLANAKWNGWPMIHIGGASPTYQNGMGAFQEERQVMAATPYCKYAQQVDRADRIPYFVEQAVRTSIFGRPGAVYLDFPDNVIREEIDEGSVSPASTVPEPPRFQAAPESIEAALDALESAERPLAIIGKGMAWSRAEDEVRAFIERTRLPFLASPMGKGVMDDGHALSVGAARSLALREADVVFLMGARLNWIMHFGLPPRFAKNVRVIQLDLHPEEIGTNVPTEVALPGDGRAVVAQLNEALKSRQWFCPDDTAWRSALAESASKNQAAIAPMLDEDASPMNYYRALRDIREWMPDDAIIVSEGANTMDIGRTQLPNSQPRKRLDAGTYGTMGVGLGFAIAAAVACPDQPVVAVEGDSGFGFSGMEVETICRLGLPVKTVVLNNGGIGASAGEEPNVEGLLPPGALTRGARYDLMMEAFGGRGFHVEDPADLRKALDDSMAVDGPTLVNVAIDPKAERKPQKFRWLTT